MDGSDSAAGRTQLISAGRLLVRHAQEHDIAGLGAELAYRFLFAVFPFGLFVAALGAYVAGLLGLDNPADDILAALGDNLPADIAAGIRPELERVIGSSRPGLLSIGAIAALWAATGGVNALMKGMNRAYDVEESRPLPLKIAVAVGLTLLAGVGVIGGFVTIVGGAFVTQELAVQAGVGAQTWSLIQLLRWPIVFALLVAAVAVLYRFAPNLRVRWRWVLLGATTFTIGWLIATAGFGFYVANFGNYGATYGALSSVIVLMLWFYLTAVLLVGGAELVAVATKVVDPSAIEQRRNEIQVDKLAREAAATVRGTVAPLNKAGAPSIPRERALVPVATSRPKTPLSRSRPAGVPPVAVAVAAVGLAIAGELLRSKLSPSR
jgi:membrane protein